MVEGFASIRFEGTSLYLTKEDFEFINTKNAIWLDLDDFPKEADKDQSHVLVEGTFDKNDKGHMGLCSGSLKKITRLEKSRRRAQ